METDFERIEQACPYCGETVKFLDEKCSHCGERLREKAGVRWDGDTAIVTDMGQIRTDDCALCGAKGAPPLEKEFTRVPWWIYLIGLILAPFTMVVGGLLIAMFVGNMVRKGGKVSFRACRACRRKWSIAEWGVTIFVVVGLFAVPFVGFQTGDALGGPYSDAGGTGILVGIATMLAAAPLSVVLVRWRYEVRCVAIEPHVELSLKFPKPHLLRRLIKEREEKRKA